MPWTAENAGEKNSKLKTPAQKKRWAAIANSVLAKGGDDAEGKAIRIANSAFDGISAMRTAGLFDQDDDSLMKMCLGGDDPDDDADDMDDDEQLDLGIGDGVTTTSHEMTDAVPLGKFKMTADGYLTAVPRVARVGIQTYKGIELGRPDLGDVRVYRPANEVFKRDALESLAHIPVTYLHPHGEMVDASNWKRHAVGETGDEILRDGDAIRVPMMVKDGATVDAIRGGTARELSVGYSTDIKWRQGVTDAGEPYDAVQTAIRANHLAVVPVARGGSSLRIGDDHGSAKGFHIMQTIVLDGIPVEVKDEQAAQIVSRHIKKLQDEKADLVGKLDKEAADKEEKDEEVTRGKKESEAKDGTIAALTKQLADAKEANSPAVLDALVKDRLVVIDAAKKVMDQKFITDNKPLEQIRRDVVVAHLGDAAAKELSDDGIKGAFLHITKDAKKAHGVNSLADAIGRHNAATDRSGINDAEAARDGAYNERIKRGQDAWRQPMKSVANQ